MKSLEFTEVELRQLHYLMLTAKFMSENSEYICGMPLVDRIISEAAAHDYKDEGFKKWSSMLKTSPEADHQFVSRFIEVICNNIATREQAGFDVSKRGEVYKLAQSLAYPYSLKEELLMDIYDDLQWRVTRLDPR